MSEVLTDHEVDGIQEYDNPMPTWLSVLFLATVLYAVGYIIVYPSFWFWSGTSHWSSTAVAASEEEKAMSERAKPVSQEVDLLDVAKDPKRLANGRSIFEFNCVACHGPNGEGKIGPSLVDQEWKYGNTQADVLESISRGRPAGMPNWRMSLKPNEVEDVAAFVLSLQKP